MNIYQGISLQYSTQIFSDYISTNHHHHLSCQPVLYLRSILSMRVSQFGYDAYRDGGRKTVRKTWQIIIQSVKTDFLFSLMIRLTE